MRKSFIFLCRYEDMPEPIREISKKWAALANAYGDCGGCVIGEGFEFKYQGKAYKLTPMSHWQGSVSWEVFVPEIKEELIKIGCQDVYFNYGVLD